MRNTEYNPLTMSTLHDRCRWPLRNNIIEQPGRLVYLLPDSIPSLALMLMEPHTKSLTPPVGDASEDRSF